MYKLYYTPLTGLHFNQKTKNLKIVAKTEGMQPALELVTQPALDPLLLKYEEWKQGLTPDVIWTFEEWVELHKEVTN